MNTNEILHMITDEFFGNDDFKPEELLEAVRSHKLNNNLEPYFKDEEEKEIILDEIDITYGNIKREKRKLYEYMMDQMIEQETYTCLAPIYPDNFKKRIRKFGKKLKIIVITGGIGVGKTTFGRELLKYLKEKGYNAQMGPEASLELSEELKIFYQDPEKHALFFQNMIIDLYRKKAEELEELDNLDYFIFDRTHIDTAVFTKTNIKDEKIITYLENKRKEIKLDDFHKVIYIKPPVNIMLKRQAERNREIETKDKNYYIKIYNAYEKMIDEMYSDHILFNSDCSIDTYSEIFKQLL